MLPDIGIVVAAYIFTRMFALIGTPITETGVYRGVQIFVRVLAAATLVIAFIVGIDLALRGTTGVSLPDIAR